MFAGVIFFYIQSITDTHNRLCMKNESRFKVWKGKPMQKSLTNTGFLRPILTDIWWLKKIIYSDIANIFFFQTHETYTDFSNICNVYLLVYTLTDSTQVSWLLCR